MTLPPAEPKFVKFQTRYAPSPTGDPHVGNIRTALFAWALARSGGGKFILRIEDTDQARLVPGSIERIMESLRWLGLDWDEGPGVGGVHGPYVQSQRLSNYHEAAAELMAVGRAYRCFCAQERLDALRDAQKAAGKPPRLDRTCCQAAPRESDRRAAAGEPFHIRFRMPEDGVTVLDDAIRGAITFENRLEGDFVIIKTDGYPTYHLASVVDDRAMRVTHVLRADEWLSSAPKHLQIYRSMGWRFPVFAHLPLILGPGGAKLSKRHGDVALLDYRDRGYLPEAMINFLAFLGWSLDDHTSYITKEELGRHFSLERVVPNPAVFDLEKLNHFNRHYIREMPEERWQAAIAEWCGRQLPPSVPRPLDSALVAAVAPLLRERVGLLGEIAPMVGFLFGDDAPAYPPALLAERLGGDTAAAAAVLDAALAALSGVAWTKEGIESAIRGIEEPLGQKLRKFVSVLYVATMGQPAGIPLFDSLALLGRERSLRRLRSARAKL